MNDTRCPMQTGEEAAILLEYLDRKLDPELMARLDRHVAHCADCSRVVDAQRSVWEALDAWAPAEVSANFDARLMERLAAERPWWRRAAAWVSGAVAWKHAVPAAAACMVLVAVALWQIPGGKHLTPDQKAGLIQKLDAEQVESTLSDVEMLRQLGLGEEPGGAAAGRSL